jgi:hypothetical protein
MTSSFDINFPKLRNIDATPVTHRGQSFLMLRDPLRLQEESILLPMQLAPLLAMCDGTMGVGELSIALEVSYGIVFTTAEIDDILGAFDKHLLLETTEITDAEREALRRFREAEVRPAALAGLSYPSDPRELNESLDGYLANVEHRPQISGIMGLISPHIDYDRGHRVYADIWKTAEQAVQSADLAIILGTDHYSEDNRFSLTYQNYATPYGMLPTPQDIVDQMSEAIGVEHAFRGELYHLNEHSIELATVWLHHMRDGKQIDLLPILCGSIAEFHESDTVIEDDAQIEAFIASLTEIVTSRQAILIAAADLAHVGPAFGGFPLDQGGRSKLRLEDERLIDTICGCDARVYYNEIAPLINKNNICGFAPIYYTLRALSKATGTAVSYDMCEADEGGTSVVSICGVAFS